MKRFDIDKEFTNLVAGYLAQGWTINTKSMSGHQGEEGKVDLVRGDQLVRIWLMKETDYNWKDLSEWHGYTMHLRVGTWNRPASDSIKHNWTVWLRDIEVFCDKKFYQVSNCGEDWYVDDLDEALETQSKRRSRWSKYSRIQEVDITNDRSKEIATKFLKNHAGYKRVSYDKIVVKKNLSDDMNHASYRVIYNGNSYRIQ